MQLFIMMALAMLILQGNAASWIGILGLILALMIAFIVNIIMRQESMLYVPNVAAGMKTPNDNPEGFQHPGQRGLSYENVYLTTDDDVKIHGWFITCKGQENAPTLLFCHANAGNMGLRVPNFAGIVSRLKINIFAFDYRGYGESEGSPSEEGLIEDALCCWRWIEESAKAGKIDGSKVFIFGRSLGGAVAIALCDQLQRMGPSEDPSKKTVVPQGVILENTFMSISQLVDTLFPYLAYKGLKDRFLRLKWYTIDRIRELKVPILLLSGLKDEIVPCQHMRALQAAAEKSRICRLIPFPEGMHNDTWEKGGETYWSCQNTFVKDCLASM